jgi:hypothetical protein
MMARELIVEPVCTNQGCEAQLEFVKGAPAGAA